MPDETTDSNLFKDVNREDKDYKLDPDCRIYLYMRLRVTFWAALVE